MPPLSLVPGEGPAPPCPPLSTAPLREHAGSGQYTTTTTTTTTTGRNKQNEEEIGRGQTGAEINRMRYGDGQEEVQRPTGSDVEADRKTYRRQEGKLNRDEQEVVQKQSGSGSEPDRK